MIVPVIRGEAPVPVGAARALTGRDRCADRLNSNEIYFLIFMLTISSGVIQCIYPIDGIPNGVNQNDVSI